MKSGDFVLVPHGGERIGKVLARVESVYDGASVAVRRWHPGMGAWGAREPRLVPLSDCAPAPETDRRVKAAKKATP